MFNQDIRERIETARLRYWQVAEACGCTDSTFSRKLRRELPPREKEKILVAISTLKSEREAGCA